MMQFDFHCQAFNAARGREGGRNHREAASISRQPNMDAHGSQHCNVANWQTVYDDFNFEVERRPMTMAVPESKAENAASTRMAALMAVERVVLGWPGYTSSKKYCSRGSRLAATRSHWLALTPALHRPSVCKEFMAVPFSTASKPNVSSRMRLVLVIGLKELLVGVESSLALKQLVFWKDPIGEKMPEESTYRDFNRACMTGLALIMIASRACSDTFHQKCKSQ